MNGETSIKNKSSSKENIVDVASPPNSRRNNLEADEEIAKHFNSILQKIIKSNKQLIAVAGVVKEQGESSVNKEQLEKERKQLMEATNTLVEDQRAAATTTNFKYVKTLVNKTSSVSKLSASLIRFCTVVATEKTKADVATFKKVSTSAITVRDALYLIVDALMKEVPLTWQDPLAEAIYFGSAKSVEKSLAQLIEHKSKVVGENIIPKGPLYEIFASASATLTSSHRLLLDFEYPLSSSSEVGESLRVAATASSQLSSSFEDSIKNTDLSFSHSLLKAGLLSLKNLLHNVTFPFNDLVE